MPDMIELSQALAQSGAYRMIISDLPEQFPGAKATFCLPAGDPEWPSPLLAVLPGQVIARQLALASGLDPNTPNGLTKVTHTWKTMLIHPLLETLKGGLIVSCQPDAKDPASDPMNHPEIMAALAQSAVMGGAVAIRADSPGHIAAVRTAVTVPIIGIYKHDLPGFDVRITPIIEDAEAIAQAGADIIAVDGTSRPRPQGRTAADFIQQVMAATGKPVIADIATLDEGIAAAEAGAAAVLTTLSGYTPYSKQQEEPDYELVEQLVRQLTVPVIAEGRYNTPAQAAHALKSGAWAVTVGSAITRPRTITAQFVQGISAWSAE